MKAKKKKEIPELESVKIKKETVDLVRENKKKSYIPIGEFFHLAALEKLNHKTK